MPMYESRCLEFTEHERKLNTLGFWKLGRVDGDDGNISPYTVVRYYEATEFIPVVPSRKVTHKYRDVHVNYMAGHYLEPPAVLQQEKLLECCVCGAFSWVAVNTAWTAHPKDSLYHQPYLSEDVTLSRPACLDPDSRWKVSGIELLAGILAYCPNHAHLAAENDAMIRASLGHRLEIIVGPPVPDKEPEMMLMAGG